MKLTKQIIYKQVFVESMLVNEKLQTPQTYTSDVLLSNLETWSLK